MPIVTNTANERPRPNTLYAKNSPFDWLAEVVPYSVTKEYTPIP